MSSETGNGTTLSAAARFLAAEELLLEVRGDLERLGQQVIKGVAGDRQAEQGELAWLSERVLVNSPERLDGFRGTLLICPEAATTTPTGDIVFFVCRQPKLAFIKTVHHFFASLCEIAWPAASGHSLAPDARIADGVRLAPGVVIGSGVVIDENVSVGPNTVIANCEIASGVSIGANCSIGLPGFGLERDDQGRLWRFPHLGKVIIESDVEIGSCTCVDRGSLGDTVLKEGCKIDNLVHIAHNVRVEEGAVVIANAMVGGSAKVGKQAWLAPSASVMNQVSVGAGALVGLGAVVLKEVRAGSVMVGNPARELEKKK